MADLADRAASRLSRPKDLPIESLVVPRAMVVEEIFVDHATTIDPAVIQFILGERFSALDGARPLERAIQNIINRPLVAGWTAGEAGCGHLTANAARMRLEFGEA